MAAAFDHNAPLRLSAWYSAARRDLPWRRTKDPYAIWVSEVMLQQTRVQAVLPYYERFLKRFPDVKTLARARIDTVLAHWSGLGYYARARNLHTAARLVAKSGFPETVEGWRALPGLGAYASAAIASIACGAEIPVVDGNVERVLSRYHAIARRDPKRLSALAARWIAGRPPGDHNQAMMELGALVCLPKAPDCPRCPLAAGCAGKKSPSRYPRKRTRPRPAVEQRAVGLARRGGRVWLRRREGETLLDGMWELPEGEPAGKPLAEVRHSILDRRLVIGVYPGRPGRGGGWFDAKRAAALPLTGATRKCLRRVGFL